MPRRLIAASFLIALMVCGIAGAQTPEWRLGGRVQYISAEATSDPVGDTGYSLELDSGPGIEFDASVKFSERFGAEFSVGTSAHRLNASPSGCCTLDGGRVWLVPVTAMAQYHHPIYGEWDPYVGLGVSWVLPFYSISGDFRDIGLDSLEFDGDGGLAFQIGTNYQLDNRWYANLDLQWSQASLEVRADSADADYPPVKLDINPFTIGFGFGYKF